MVDFRELAEAFVSGCARGLGQMEKLGVSLSPYVSFKPKGNKNFRTWT